MQTSTHPSWGKRLLAMAVALALLLTYLPVRSAPHVHAESVEGNVTDPGSSSVVFVDEGGDLFAAIDSLPSTGGTVVVRGNLTIKTIAGGNAYHTWTAKEGNIVVTGLYNGHNYNPTIEFAGSVKHNIDCASAIEFNHLTLKHNGSTSGATEFYAGPSLTIGYGMTFLNGNSVINASTSGVICFRGGRYTGNSVNTSMEFFSGRFSYIQAGNGRYNVTGTSTIKVHPGVTVTDFLQCGGTNSGQAANVNVTIDGADIGWVYIGGYGTGKTSVTGDLKLNIKNTKLQALYGQRLTTTVHSVGGQGTISGNLDLTLDAVDVETWNLDSFTVNGTRTLTVKNATDLTITDTLADWNSLSLENSTVWVDAAYAGPETYTADEKSVLIIDDTATAEENIPAGAEKESLAVINLAGGVNADLQGAYDTLANRGVKGGIIVLTDELIMTLSSSDMNWPTYSGPVTITASGEGKLTLKGRSTASRMNITTITKFSNISINEVGDGAYELFASSDLTFGEGITCTSGGKTMGVSENGELVVRIGNSSTTNQSGSFTMHSGTVSHIHGGNNQKNVVTANIYVGKGATVTTFVQAGGTRGNASKATGVESSTIVIDNATVNAVYLGGYSGSSSSVSEVGDVDVTIINTNLNCLYGERGAVTTVTLGSVLGDVDSLSLTLENSYVTTWNLSKLKVNNGGTSSLTLKNYACMEFDADLANNFAWFDSLTLNNAVVKLTDIAYTGYDSAVVLNDSPNADGDILVSICHNDTLPTVTGADVIFYNTHTLEKTADAVANSCESAGNEAYWTCTVCGRFFADENAEEEFEDNEWVIPAGHKLTKTDAVNATCLAAGHAAYWTCSVCGNNYKDDAASSLIEDIDSWLAEGGEGHVEKKDHNYDPETGICSNGCGLKVCDHEGHSYTYACSETCSVCGEANADAVAHSYQNACDTTCDVCGDERTVGDHISNAHPCQDGKCTICGADVPASAEHTYQNACDTTCDVCGDERTVGEHNWDNGVCSICNTECVHNWGTGVYTKPTFDADGYTTYTCNICGVTKVETDAGSQLTAVAKVGNELFATLDEAIAAAQNGGTIELLADVVVDETVTVPEGANIVLNLNGYSITSTVTSGFGGVALANNGTLTINGNGTISGSYGAVYNAIGANLTINGGNYEVNNGFGLINDGIAVIEGGTFEGVGSYNPAELTINGGTFNEGNDPDDPYLTLGKFALSIRADFIGRDDMSTTSVTINGGTFNGNVLSTSAGGDYIIEAYNITNGTFNGKFVSTGDEVTDPPVISGGTFACDISNFCAYGYIPKDNGDGTYGVKVGYYAAQNRDTGIYYEFLADAIAEAKNYDYINVLRDVTIDSVIKIEKNITLNLHGYKITSTAQKAFEIYNDVTIKNGTIKAIQRCVDTRTAVKLTLDTVTLLVDGYTAAYGNPQPLTIGGYDDGTEVIITNSDIQAGNTGYGIITFVKTELTATESDISGYMALFVKAGSEGSEFNFVDSNLTSDISNNDVERNASAAINVVTDDVTVNISGGKVTAVGNNTASFAIGDVGNVAITADTQLEGNILSYHSVETNSVSVRAEYADELAAEGVAYENSATSGMIDVTGDAVAEVNGKPYASLAEAVANANGGTVKLLADITVDAEMATSGNVTIDLGGKTLTVTEQITVNEGHTLKVTGEGKLIVNAQVAVSGTLDVYDLGYGTSGLVPGQSGNLAIADGGKVVLMSVWSNQTAELLNNYRNTFFAGSVDGAQVALGTKNYTLTNGIWMIEGAVAAIDREYNGNSYTETYASLADALSDAKPGETIKLLADITLNDVIVISNKVTITADSAVTITSDKEDVLEVTGELTLGANITIESTNSILYANGGIINIDGAVLKSNHQTNALGYAGNGGTISLISGSVEAYWTGLTASGNGSNVNISGGSIESTNSNGVLAKNNATATISGGSVTTADYAALWAKDGGKLVVTGGTVTTGSESNAISVEANASATVSGGSFCGTISVRGGATLAVSGGTFSVPVAEEYCAAGYIPADNGDGTYGVKVGEYIARNTTTGVGYETLAEAIAAAQAGETIKLLADITVDAEMATSGNVTIDLGGKTLTVTKQITVNANDTLKVTGEGKLVVNAQVAVSGTLDVYDLGYGTSGLVPGQSGNLAIANGGKVVLMSVWSNQTAELLNNYRNTFFAGSVDGAQVALGTKNYTLTNGIWMIEGAVAAIDREYNGNSYTETYASLADALSDAKPGETIKLLADVTLSTPADATGKIIDLNGYTLTGNIAATIKVNGGSIITADNYPIAGGAGSAYLTTDATFIIDVNNNITVAAGNVTLGQSMNTMPNQKLVVAEGATFTIPAGKTLNVYSDLTVDGTIVNNGTLKLATGGVITAPAGLTVDAIDSDTVLYVGGKYITHNHSYDDGVITINPGCTTEGEKTFTCDCGDFYTETVDATGHDLTHVGANDPTCTEDGNIEYWTCDICGKYYDSEDAANEIEEGSWVTEALNHKNKKHYYEAAPGYTNPGNTEYWACPDCGKFFNAAGEEIEKDSWIIPPRGTPNKVYVSDSGNDTNTGLTADQAFKTLRQAYLYLAVYHPNSESTIIVCGQVTINDVVTLDTLGVTGKVTITSLDGEVNYAETNDAQIYFACASANKTIYFGAKTELNNISLIAERSKKSAFIFTGLDMVFGENITTNNDNDKDQNDKMILFKVFCAASDSSENDVVNVEMKSGDFNTVFMGGNTKSTNGNVNLTIDGASVDVLYSGPNSSAANKSTGKNMNLTLKSGSIRVLYTVPNVSGTVEDIVVNWNGGSITKIQDKSGNNSKLNNFTLKITGFDGFAITNPFLTWYDATITGKVTLELIDFNGEFASGKFKNVNVLNIKGASNVSYGDTLVDGQVVTVEAGSTLYLACGAKELPANTVINASVGYTEGAQTTGGIVRYAVAQVGDAKYATFEEALANANGETIKLLADITLTQRLDVADALSIDLNGNTISGSFEDDFGMIYVKKGGSLTVDGEGKITSSGTYAIGNYGTVTLKNGTLESTATYDYEGEPYTYAALYNFYYAADTFGTAIIEGGSVGELWNSGITSVSGGEVEYLDNSGALTVTGGTISEIYAQDGADAEGVPGAGTLTITDISAVETPDNYTLVEISNGVYKVTLLGDANNDGVVNAEDAKLIKQYRAGLVEADALELDVCDLDGNGKVDVYDAYLIQLFVAGMVDVFPAG